MKMMNLVMICVGRYTRASLAKYLSENSGVCIQDANRHISHGALLNDGFGVAHITRSAGFGGPQWIVTFAQPGRKDGE